jgi:hypothetical protein
MAWLGYRDLPYTVINTTATPCHKKLDMLEGSSHVDNVEQVSIEIIPEWSTSALIEANSAKPQSSLSPRQIAQLG